MKLFQEIWTTFYYFIIGVKMASLPSLFELQEVLFNEESCIEYLIQIGVIDNKERCDRCMNDVRISIIGNLGDVQRLDVKPKFPYS